MLTLREISFSYPDSEKPTLRGVNLTIDKGDLIRITGRNGSGKSTLLKIVAGELSISGGGIECDQSLKRVYLDQFAGDMLPMDLTLLEIWSAFSRNLTNADATISIKETVEKFGIGLEHRLHSFCGEMSGGERQIIALSIAANSNYNLLCLDEFTASLDSIAKLVAIDTIVDAIRKENTAICVVSHDTIEFDNIRTVALEKGTVK
jgi:ABC-type uncharacterized transport system ATPase component